MSNLVRSKDSQWLQLNVCREFQSNNCPRTDDSCKNAHPGQHVETINGKVMACYDSCKGRCTREICKYYHPSSSMMEQLLLKGRNHLAMKNALVQPVSVLPSMFLPVQSEVPTMVAESESPLKVGTARKRSAEASPESFYPAMFCKRPAMEAIPFPFYSSVPYQSIFQLPSPAERKFLKSICSRQLSDN